MSINDSRAMEHAVQIVSAIAQAGNLQCTGIPMGADEQTLQSVAEDEVTCPVF